jgi:pyruvate/2-oxoglutarate/acetoin dehydrogenase E1 component
MNYLEAVVEQINLALDNNKSNILIGENINTGSHLVGLTRNIVINSKSRIFNVPNSELTHCGTGMGVMLNKGNCVLFCKQIDFLLLGLDQICNTYNLIRSTYDSSELGSFTIVVIVCDQGYQGAQSSLNCAEDIYSLANIPVYSLNSLIDIEDVIKNNLCSNKFKIIFLSQKKFNSNLEKINVVYKTSDCSVYQFDKGNNCTIISSNFTLDTTIQINNFLKKKKIFSDIFFVNPTSKINKKILSSLKKNRKLIIINDSKSQNKYTDKMISDYLSLGINFQCQKFYRGIFNNSQYGVNEDSYKVKFKEIINFIKTKTSC